jgi:hypothetical protein
VTAWSAAAANSLAAAAIEWRVASAAPFLLGALGCALLFQRLGWLLLFLFLTIHALAHVVSPYVGDPNCSRRYARRLV